MSNETSAPPKRLAGKLAEVSAAVGTIAKRGRNEHHKYDYATEADVALAVRDELARRRIAFLPFVDEVGVRETTTSRGNATAITQLGVRIDFVDGDTGEELSVRVVGQGDDPGDKGASKAFTAAVKYALLKTFLIPTGDDPEGDSEVDQRHAPATQTAGQARPAAQAAQAAQQQSRSRAAQGNDRTATEGQQKLIHAKKIEAGASDEDLQKILLGIGSVNDVAKLPMRLVDAVLKELTS